MSATAEQHNPSSTDRGSEAVPERSGSDSGVAVASTDERIYDLVRTVSWPGGGVQLTFAAVPEPSRNEKPRVLREDGIEVAFQRAAAKNDNGLTAFLVAPAAEASEQAARLDAVRAVVAELPAGERLGLWLGSGRLPLVCELTERREHLFERLAAILSQTAASDPIDPVSLAQLQQRLSKVGGPNSRMLRSMIAVGVPHHPANDNNGPVPTLRLEWNDPFKAAAAGKEMAARLIRSRGAHFRLGVCEVHAGERLRVELGSQHFEVTVPLTTDTTAAACDADAAARDDYPVPNAVRLVMNEAQLAEHNRLAAALSEARFLFDVSLGGETPIPAYGNFRGKTSLECERKSYDVHFADGAARRLMANAYGDEFLLISMCWDKGWFRQVLANRTMHKLGLFPLEQRYVTLRVADRELGVYLMLEKPDIALRRQQSQLAGLIRRRSDHDGAPPEPIFPKYGRNPELAQRAVSEYEAVVALVNDVEPSMLADALSARLDLKGYLSWLAVMTYFQNGDYVDEVFFYASDEVEGWYFRNFGWDSDDLFAPCHGNGQFALTDPHGLLYCLEGNLDRALLVAPDIYARFVEVLSKLLTDELAPEKVVGVLSEVHDELSALFVDDAVCAGTGLVIDGEVASCAKLRQWLSGQIREFEMLIRARAELLAERIRTFGATR